MPHLILEFSAPLAEQSDLGAVLDALGECAASTGVMRREDLKLRAVAHPYFKLLDGGDSFAHLTVRLLSGRSPEQKRQLSEALRTCLVLELPQVHSLSVDIVDMDPEAYLKRLL